MNLREQFEKKHGLVPVLHSTRGEWTMGRIQYVEWLEKLNTELQQRLRANQHDTAVNCTTEKEAEARVDFKLSELLTGLENRAKAEWNNAFQTGSQKHSYYWEAFTELKKMLRKEIEMATPYDEMAEKRREEKRDEAVEKISKRLIKRGERDYHGKLKAVVDAIEKAQQW